LAANGSGQQWPSLRVDDWTETRDTLHMWTQIVGKVRMAQMPLINHWWQVPLYVSPRGLSTHAIPAGLATFDMEFDFIRHVLAIRHSDGGERSVSLRDTTVADFYRETMAALADFGITPRFQPSPNEVDPAIPFADDRRHATYHPEVANLFWQQLIQADRVIGQFRADFLGKVSPVHFFWGSFDLACTRFSGRRAPEHGGGAPNCGDWVMVEGYSHELSSCGFWPGGAAEGAFYSYAYPEPPGFASHAVAPEGAYFSDEFKQFLLPYEAVRTADDPDGALTAFLQSTYAAAADLGGWDRGALECDPRRWDRHRYHRDT